MKTWIKILLLLIAVVLLFKLWPVVAAALGVASLFAVIGGGLLAVAAVAVAGVGVGLVCLVLAVAALLALGLSPIWLPILAVIGIINLVRRKRTPVSAAHAV
ncbi:MAG: hypothetical protein SFV32_10385 [Opitutaceae bacterium]|nr:hypothetical protein [Opitutaceae bacterium]